MKRSLILVIHSLAVLLAIAGLSVLYISSPAGYGLSWTQKECYADTPQFAQQFNEDVGQIKALAYLKDTFEENGELDMDAIVAETEQDGMYAPLSLRSAMQTAQKFGCYMDPATHRLTISSVDKQTEASNYEVKVTYKYYDPHYFETVPMGPGIGVVSIKDLSFEIMRALSRYHILREQYLETPGNLYFETHFMGDNGEYTELSNTEMSTEELFGLGKYVSVSGESQETESNVDPVPENALQIETSFNPNETDEEYSLIVAVDTAYPYRDAYQKAALSFEGDVRKAYLGLGALGVGALFALCSGILLLRLDGYASREEALRLRPADKLPYELFLIGCAAAAAAGCFLMAQTGYRAVRIVTPQEQWNYWRKLLNALVIYAVLLYAAIGTARRAESGAGFKNTVIGGLVSDLNSYVGGRSLAATLLLRFVLFVGAHLLGAAVLIWLYLNRGESSAYVLFFAGILVLLSGGDLYFFRTLYRKARQQDAIELVLSHLSEGDTECEIALSEFSGRELKTAEQISHISTGMRAALMEQVKSERLKADLITNVSHDIRTPLTSIINYVDLLKREDIRDEKIREYIRVLDQKTARLKNLTEDLLEASKASSGNIKLEMHPLDLNELSMQAGAEFEDKFALRGLTLCPGGPEHPVMIEADGRYLWRVLENLYNNAAKYSMPQTRVYAEVTEEADRAVFTLKNVSEGKLNISPDELTERFVRGDVARTTEGSGLGLSIAASLTKLMGGELIIEIDGDLYKANVIFPIRKEEDDR